MCIIGCRRTTWSKRRGHKSYFISSTLFSIISNLSSTSLCFFCILCSTGGLVFSTGGSCRNHREPEMVPKRSLRVREASWRACKPSYSYQPSFPSIPHLHHIIIIIFFLPVTGKERNQFLEKNKTKDKGRNTSNLTCNLPITSTSPWTSLASSSQL